jgi:hypothetical protein
MGTGFGSINISKRTESVQDVIHVLSSSFLAGLG